MFSTTPKEEKKCMVPDCPAQNPKISRGYCQSHLGALYKLIKSGKLSEEDLMKKGMLLPRTAGRKSSIFLPQLEDFLKGKGVL